MKNTIRVRKNRSASRVASQAQIPLPAKTQSTAAVQKYRLSLMTWTEGNPSNPIVLGEIDVPTGDFEILQRDALKRGDAAFDQLLQVGYEAMVNAFNGKFELENATAANNALMQLLVENMDFQRRDSSASSFAGGEGSESLCFGIFQLVRFCRERLAKALEVAS